MREIPGLDVLPLAIVASEFVREGVVVVFSEEVIGSETFALEAEAVGASLLEVEAGLVLSVPDATDGEGSEANAVLALDDGLLLIAL